MTGNNQNENSSTLEVEPTPPFIPPACGGERGGVGGERRSQLVQPPTESPEVLRLPLEGGVRKSIILAAGGTGGHVFPALATADELKSRGYKVFFATDTRGEKYIKGHSYDYKIIASDSPSGGYIKRMRAFAKICYGTIQSGFLIGKLRPVAVIGYGGYPSFPPLMAASINGITTILHEQNSILGKANRFLGRYCSQIATSFPDTKNAVNAKLVGNPVRGEIIEILYPTTIGKINILVTGGSQGAKLFADILPAALSEFSDKITVTHQVRDEELQSVSKIYTKSGLQFELKSFFDDMPTRLAAAHLVICRAGASTVFELARAGRPGLFIPLKNSAENHQYFNAKAVIDIGGGWLLEEKDFNHAALCAMLSELINQPQKLAQAAASIKTFGTPNAAKTLSDLVEELIK